MSHQNTITSSVNSSTVADILERVLDKGIVVAGDICVKICDIELLTIQLRLVVCSVEKAKEIGLDWWNHTPAVTHKDAVTHTDESVRLDDAHPTKLETSSAPPAEARIERLSAQIARLEKQLEMSQRTD